MKKNFIFIKIIIFIFLVIVLITLGLKFFYKEKKNNLDETNHIETIDFFSCESEICEYNIKVDEKIIPVKYELINNEDTYNLNLHINNKKVVEEELLCGGPTFLEIFNNYIILAYRKSCTVSDNVILGLKYDGTEMFKYDNDIDESSNLNLQLVNFPEENKIFKISDNKIFIYGSSIIDEKIHFKKNGISNSINQCDINERNKNEILPSYIIRGEYEIVYDKNTFSKPIFKNGFTLQEYIVCN